MKKRRIICFILVFSLCFVTFSFASISDEINEKKSEIQQNKEKESQVESEIEELNDSLNEAQDEIDSIAGEINGIQINISNVQGELDDIEADINTQNEGLNKRLRSMYMNDNVSFVDIILNSGSISDLLTNLELIKRIHKSDKEVLSGLKEQQEKIQQKKDELKALEASLSSEKAEYEEKYASLEEDKSVLNEKKASIQADTEEAEEELSDLQAEANKITQQLSTRKSEGTYGGGMIWPCSGSITSEYGYRYCPYHGYELHSGIDIAVSTGTSVKAAASGTVIQAYYNSSYGNMILLDNGSGICTLYAHNSKLLVSVGQKVSQGDVIAKSGNTGSSTGPHCHFEVRLNGQPVNPRNYL